jgi:hypothetical protein
MLSSGKAPHLSVDARISFILHETGVQANLLCTAISRSIMLVIPRIILSEK